jgi:hypothetical protein
MFFCPETGQAMKVTTDSGKLLCMSPTGKMYDASAEASLRYTKFLADSNEITNSVAIKYAEEDKSNPHIIADCPKCKEKRLVRYIFIGADKKTLMFCRWNGCGEKWIN